VRKCYILYTLIDNNINEIQNTYIPSILSFPADSTFAISSSVLPPSPSVSEVSERMIKHNELHSRDLWRNDIIDIYYNKSFIVCYIVHLTIYNNFITIWKIILEMKYAYIPWFTITFLSFPVDSTLVDSSSILPFSSSVSVVSEIIINHNKL